VIPLSLLFLMVRAFLLTAMNKNKEDHKIKGIFEYNILGLSRIKLVLVVIDVIVL
jgi:hypothetical protein